MPTLSYWFSTQVNQPGADESKNVSAVTCFGLPGTAGINPSMSSCHFEVKLAVYDYKDVYLGINGQISDPVIASNDYDSGLWFSPSSWVFATQVNGTTVDGNGLVVDGIQYVNPQYNASAGKVIFYKYAQIDASNGEASNAPTWASGQTAYDASLNPRTGASYGWYKWDMGCPNPTDGTYPSEGYVRIGSVSDFGAGEDSNGYVYVGGTGTYAGTNYNYPNPYRITIPGWHPQEPEDYYPFAIRKSNAWASANRGIGEAGTYIRGYIPHSGDSDTPIVQSTAVDGWIDVKNFEDDSYFAGSYRKSGSWARAPKFT